jgi:hypothetical protein
MNQTDHKRDNLFRIYLSRRQTFIQQPRMATTQVYIEDGPQDRKVSARAVLFGGDKQFSCCPNNRFPFSTIGGN